MKVLIDTNVLLDVLCDRQEFAEASAMVMKHCELGNLEGYISALSFPNLVYIMRKELTKEKTEQIINELCRVFTVSDLKAGDVKKAASLNFDDYEDAIQAICASRVNAQYIITRNIKDFKNSKVPAIKPEELLERL